MARNTTLSSVPLGVGCTPYTGAEVSITVPGAGTVVVYAIVTIQISHTTGTLDEVDLNLTEMPAACQPRDGWTTYVIVASGEATATNMFESVPLQRPFLVASAGTFTYHVNGVGVGDIGAGDSFISASLVAVFYPS